MNEHIKYFYDHACLQKKKKILNSTVNNIIAGNKMIMTYDNMSDNGGDIAH